MIEAMRLLGEFWKAAPKNVGGRPPKTGSPMEPVSTPTLAELGLTKKLSARSR